MSRPIKHSTPEFFIPDVNDPLDKLMCSGLNIFSAAALAALKNEANRFLGLSAMSSTDQITLSMTRVRLIRAENEAEKAKLVSEKTLRLLDLRIAQKEAEMEKQKAALAAAQNQNAQLQLPPGDTIIMGALEVAAEAGGLSGSPEQAEAYARWLDGFQEGKVVLVTGRRGSGKTALIAKMAEYMAATYQMPTYWLGLPEAARKLLPTWVSMIDDAYKAPVNSFIVTDEAGINFLSLLFQDKRNQFMRRLLMVCRQRHCSLVFAVQNTKDVDLSIVRQADSVIFKQPGMHQPDTERADIRPMAKQAAEIFAGMTRDEALESAFVVDDDFQGVLKFTPPSFWSEELSHVYAHLDLMAIEKEAQLRKGLRSTIADSSHQIEEASIDSRILELRRKGQGIESIAKTLNLSVYKVRKVVEPAEREGGGV